MRALPMIALLVAVACGEPDPSADVARVDAVPQAEAPELGDDVRVFESRVAVLMLADAAVLDSLRALHGEEDFHVIADDMMYYRAEAFAWLEEHGIPVVELEGRPAVAFAVEGEPAPFEFSADHPLDLVVLYQPGQAPVPVAPVDVTMTAPAYFGVPQP